MVVPLLAGGGTRIKILEAMAMGVPVISTTIGAEGLELQEGVHIEIAAEANAFAEVTGRLLGDAAWRRNLADAAFERLIQENRWESVVDQFFQLSTE